MNATVVRRRGARIAQAGAVVAHRRAPACLGVAARRLQVRSHTLGISTGNPLSFEPALDVFNGSALLAADYAIAAAEAAGLRLVVPLTDQWHYYHGAI